jgi:hypothetical protein
MRYSSWRTREVSKKCFKFLDVGRSENAEVTEADTKLIQHEVESRTEKPTRIDGTLKTIFLNMLIDEERRR